MTCEVPLDPCLSFPRIRDALSSRLGGFYPPFWSPCPTCSSFSSLVLCSPRTTFRGSVLSLSRLPRLLLLCGAGSPLLLQPASARALHVPVFAGSFAVPFRLLSWSSAMVLRLSLSSKVPVFVSFAIRCVAALSPPGWPFTWLFPSPFSWPTAVSHCVGAPDGSHLPRPLSFLPPSFWQFTLLSAFLFLAASCACTPVRISLGLLCPLSLGVRAVSFRRRCCVLAEPFPCRRRGHSLGSHVVASASALVFLRGVRSRFSVAARRRACCAHGLRLRASRVLLARSVLAQPRLTALTSRAWCRSSSLRCRSGPSAFLFFYPFHALPLLFPLRCLFRPRSAFFSLPSLRLPLRFLPLLLYLSPG